MLQELSSKQIAEAIYLSVDKNVPLTVAVQTDVTWTNLHSRILAGRDGQIWVEYPNADTGQPPVEFVPGQTIAVSLKLRHHKHIFTTTVASRGTCEVWQTRVPALALEWPKRMQRLQRRAFCRAAVPPGKIVRASFWLGGRMAEPRCVSAAEPVWSGQVTNLSAGGFQLLTTTAAGTQVEVGETVGVHLSFGLSSRDGVYADAQFRHVDIEGDKAVMGFQFVGLGNSPEAQRTLEIVSSKVHEYQRLAEAHGEVVRAESD